MTLSFPEFFLRLLVATVLGAALGWEREATEHNAGLRTNALVALGTALFTVISGYGFLEFTKLQHIQADPTRIASYVVAGIGFLGGGTIFLRKDSQRMRGLTSAATIWIVAAVGMACGAGMLVEAVVTTLLALFILVVLRFAEGFLFRTHSQHVQILTIELREEAQGDVIGRMYDIMEQARVQVEKIDIHNEENGTLEEGKVVVDVYCRCKQLSDMTQAADDIRKLPFVEKIQITRKGTFGIGNEM